MKIAIVIPNLQTGGAERVATRLANYWAGRHEVRVVLFENRIEYECRAPVRCLELQASSSAFVKLTNVLRRAWRLRRFLREFRPDRTIAFLETANMPAVLTGLPVVVTVRNDPRALFGTRVLGLQRWLYRRKNVRRVVCNSRRMETVVRELYDTTRTAVIYNPVDPDELQRSAAAFEPDQAGPFLVSAGRFTSQKNFPLLIRAFCRSRARDAFRLVILGAGPLRDELVRLVESEGGADRVAMPGAVSNPFAYFRRAAGFVLSSDHEGFPNVVLESLACETPVLATDCDFGPSEVIDSGKNGVLFPVGGEQELIALFNRAADEPAWLAGMRPACLPSVAAFRIETVSDRWLADT